MRTTVTNKLWLTAIWLTGVFALLVSGAMIAADKSFGGWVVAPWVPFGFCVAGRAWVTWLLAPENG